MPTFESLARFDREFRRLPHEPEAAFLAMLPTFIAALRARAHRRSRRLCGSSECKGRQDVWEITFAPDGRATFAYGEEVIAGTPHVIWRRVGTHDVAATRKRPTACRGPCHGEPAKPASNDSVPAITGRRWPLAAKPAPASKHLVRASGEEQDALLNELEMCILVCAPGVGADLVGRAGIDKDPPQPRSTNTKPSSREDLTHDRDPVGG